MSENLPLWTEGELSALTGTGGQYTFLATGTHESCPSLLLRWVSSNKQRPSVRKKNQNEFDISKALFFIFQKQMWHMMCGRWRKKNKNKFFWILCLSNFIVYSCMNNCQHEFWNAFYNCFKASSIFFNRHSTRHNYEKRNFLSLKFS